MLILTRRWLIRTLRNKELKTKKSREPESLSVVASSTLSNKSLTNLSVTQKPKASRSQVPLDCPTNIFVSAPEEVLAVRVLRPTTAGK